MWTAVSIFNFLAALVIVFSGIDGWRHGNRAGAAFMFLLGASVSSMALKFWWG